MTPTSFVNVTKWTRTHTSRLLLEAGFGIYDQEYTELYQPDGDRELGQGVGSECHSQFEGLRRLAIRRLPQAGQRVELAGGSLLAAAHLHGRGLVRHRLAHSFRFGGGCHARRLAAARSSAPAMCSRSPTTPAGRSAVHAAPAVRSPQRHQGRHRSVRAGPLGRSAASR